MQRGWSSVGSFGVSRRGPYARLFAGVTFALVLSVSAEAKPRPPADTHVIDKVCQDCHDKPALKRHDGGSATVDSDAVARSLHGRAHVGCVSCHADLIAAPAAHASRRSGVQPAACLPCHDEAPQAHVFHPQMVPKPDKIACQDCHGGHAIVGAKDPSFKFARAGQSAACGTCHEAMRDDLAQSPHGKALAQGSADAPDCLTCHALPLLTPPAGVSAIAIKQNQAKVCLSCHLDKPSVRSRLSPAAGFIASYEQSVHGRALAAGHEKAPSCSNCHGSHAISKGRDPASQVSRSNIAETCAECHEEQAKAFKGSIHAAALTKGSEDAPTCTSCHGEHDILEHNDPRAAVAPANVSEKICAPCHSSVKLAKKYGIRGDRAETFERSYHGLAMKGGDIEVANCASCHGVHDILPSSDPRSRVNKANLAATCGKCHPGANENFTTSPIHVSLERGNEPALYWLSTLYLLFVVSVVGSMSLHNLLDFAKRARRHFAYREGEGPLTATPHRLYVRMTGHERLQHSALIVSFTALVFTGFMLRYPDAWWVAWVRSAHARVFQWRGVVHRAAGVLLLASAVWHLAYVAFTSRGRAFFRDILPQRKDLHDAWGFLRYNLGLASTRPPLDRFSYAEKLEYWALVWGTVIMATTGLMMWFDNSAMRLFTKHGYDVARVIHFFEAWLATLSIVVWHFYFVIFNPDAYPMTLSWLTGKLTEQEMAEEHPLELARLKDAEACAAKDTAPAPAQPGEAPVPSSKPDDPDGGAP